MKSNLKKSFVKVKDEIGTLNEGGGLKKHLNEIKIKLVTEESFKILEDGVRKCAEILKPEKPLKEKLSDEEFFMRNITIMSQMITVKDEAEKMIK